MNGLSEYGRSHFVRYPLLEFLIVSDEKRLSVIFEPDHAEKDLGDLVVS
jgi:hypothetical protein